MSFGAYTPGATGAGVPTVYGFQNPVAKGAGAYVVWAVVFNSSTVIVGSVVSDRGRSMTRKVHLTTANRTLEVWTIPHSEKDFSFTALVSETVGASFGAFIIHGVDERNPFGAIFSRTSNSGTTSSLTVTDAEYDSYIFDFFATTNLGISVPGNDEIVVGETYNHDGPGSTGSELSVAMKPSYPEPTTVSQTAFGTGEILHAAFVVRSMFRRDPEYLAALEDETAERSFLTEVGAAEQARDNWTQHSGTAGPGVTGVTTSNTSPFTHNIGTQPTDLQIVNVFSTTASSAVTYGGKAMRLFLRLNNIEWWWLLSTIKTGSVVVTNAGTIEHIIARSLTNVNELIPIRAVYNFDSHAVPDGTAIGPWQPTTAYENDLILDAARVNSTVTATPIFSGIGGQIQDSNVQAGGGRTYLSSNILILTDSGPNAFAGAWSLGAAVTWDTIRIAIAPTMSWHIFSRPFTRVITGGDNRSGIQRNFHHVEVNGEALLEQPSLATMMMQGANGSFYYDETTDIVYVRTSTGLSPTTFATVTFEFFVLVGNRLVDFLGGDYYDPRLTGQLPSISGQSSDLTFGVTSYPSGTIDLLNTDRFFDLYTNTWFWKNREIKFFFGSEHLTRNQYRQVGGMLIDDVQPGYETVAFQLRAVGNALQVNLLQSTLGTYFASFELTNADLKSEFLPYLIGKVNNVEARFFSDTTLLGDPPTGFRYRYFASVDSQPPRAVRVVNKQTGVVTELSPVSDWLYFGTLIGLRDPYSPDAYAVLADVGNVSAYAGETLRQLLVRAGVPLSQIDSRAFALVDQDEPYEIGIYESEQRSIEEVTRLIEQSTFFNLYVTADGVWSVREWAPTSEDFDVLPVLSDSNLKEIPQPHFQPLTPFFEFVIQYAYEPFFTSYKEESSVLLETIGLYKTIETFYRRTCLVNQSDAVQLAIRCHTVQLTKPTTFDIEEVGFNLLDLVIFDKFRLSLQRAPNYNGFWDNEIVQILEFTKTFNPESIKVVVDNMRGLGAGVKVSAPDGDPDWDDSSPLDRIRYAFAADDATERVDVADPSTEGQAFAW